MSRRRLYLDLKASIIQLFRTPAHWLKEFTGKWSIFEKPYLDQDYRKMHLDWPRPDWPRIGPWGIWPRPMWPERPGTWTFQFDPGICWLGVMKTDCGETFRLPVSIALLPLHGLGMEIVFEAFSSEPEHVRITDIEQPGPSFSSGTIVGEIADDWTGTAVICVQGRTTGGRVLTGFTVENPFYGGSGILGLREALKLPKLWQQEADVIWEDCGCQEIEVTCDCDNSGIAYDWVTSDETITRPNGGGETATVAITDSGAGGPYYWTVSGTGFTLDNASTVGLTNTLNADATACGSATITVSRCSGGIAGAVEGSVRCTSVGAWAQADICDGTGNAGCTAWHCTLPAITEGKYRYTAKFPNCDISTNPACCSDALVTNCGACPGGDQFESECQAGDCVPWICEDLCFCDYLKTEEWQCS